ncbi:endonuclease VII domain-containing protein, partial [Bacillus mobilis]|uniref:endonuclease VII domain-containing protein n=2 Tax=Bacillati TaxID=1783272 RepID=UPI00398D069F
KPGDEFARDRSKPDGRDTRCKACARQATSEYRREHPERVRATAARSYRRTYQTTRAYKLKRLYGLTVLEYDDLFKAQGGRCAICRQPETARDNKTGAVRDLAVDHCHNSSKVRGLLCARCNSAIGLLNDDADVLRSAIRYLEETCRDGTGQ